MIMNKTYMKPEVEILDVEAQELMAISGDLENGFDLNDADETESIIGNHAREFLFFED